MSDEERRDALVQRLEDGFTRIGEAMQRRQDVASWEAFWVSLLREYEKIEDAIVAHHALRGHQIAQDARKG